MFDSLLVRLAMIIVAAGAFMTGIGFFLVGDIGDGILNMVVSVLVSIVFAWVL
ncbi:MAG: hypothetical protein FWD06_07430 [Oscillospiraceae bacterium]|nr:hypothetical protein [Oscillospiraceae bacterium]